MSSLESDVAVLKAQGEETHEMVKEIHKAIWVGNGKPSFSTRLDRMETAEIKRAEDIKKRDTKNNIILSAVAGALVLELFVLIF